MDIYISCDDYHEKSLKTKEKAGELIKKYNWRLVKNINDSNIVFSIGGDGTFLKSSKLSFKPIIGINTGTLGYLTEINPENLEDIFKCIENGDFYMERRMMLDGEIIRFNGDVIKIPTALNEIAISKNTFGVVRFDAIVDGKLINSYTADGILVCTPTGSTAYNLSCGGPIVDPTAKIITLTPIAPHSILNRSIVLSYKSEVEIKITELRNNTQSYVLSDGEAFEVFSGDRIKIKKSHRFIEILKLERKSFIDNIREHIS